MPSSPPTSRAPSCTATWSAPGRWSRSGGWSGATSSTASSRSSSCSICARPRATPTTAARSPASTRPARPPTAAAGSAASPAGRPSGPSRPTAAGPSARGDRGAAVTSPLAPLLEPRALAVVGASARSGSFGDQLVTQLLAGGYRGAVHLVNPRYREIAGRPCHPSLADLPGPVDLAVLAVPNAALETQLTAAAGIPAAVIFASCVEPDPSGGRLLPPRTPPTMPCRTLPRRTAPAPGRAAGRDRPRGRDGGVRRQRHGVLQP